MRRLLLIILSIAVSTLFLYLVLRDVPLAAVAEYITQANPIWVLLSFLTILIALWTRAIRWRGLLNNRIGQRDAFFIIGVTFVLNQLPLRVGEVARSLLAAQRGVPLMTAATSILLERLMDTLLVVLLLALAVAQLPAVEPQVTQGATLFGIAGIVGFSVLLLFARFPQIPRNILTLTHRVLPILQRLPLADWLDHVLDGLQALTDLRTFSHLLIWTLISWGVSLLSLYTLIQALGISENQWLTSVLGMSLASLSIAIPVSVAALGLFEGAIKLTGELLGLTEISYTALGLLFHGVTVLGYVAVGVIGGLGLGVSLSDVFKQDNKAEQNQ